MQAKYKVSWTDLSYTQKKRSGRGWKEGGQCAGLWWVVGGQSVAGHCLNVAAASEGIGRKDGHLRRGTPLAFLPRKACQTWKTCEVMFDIGFEPAFREVHIKTVESPRFRTRSEPVRTLSEPARNGLQLWKNCARRKNCEVVHGMPFERDPNPH